MTRTSTQTQTQTRTESLRALDHLNLFLAYVRLGFSAFVSDYMTAQKWIALEIGAALSIGTIATIVSQIPAGMLVDALHSKRTAVAAGIVAIALSALLFAIAPFRLSVAV